MLPLPDNIFLISLLYFPQLQIETPDATSSNTLSNTVINKD